MPDWIGPDRLLPPRLSIRVPPGRPINELAAFAHDCEEAGLHGVGVPDHHHTGRDVYLTLSAMAAQTQTLKVFPATSNVVTRHPLVIAAMMNSLNEIAPHRAMLTVAPGFLSVEKAGAAQARRDQVRESVSVLRSLLASGRGDYQGHELHLDQYPGADTRVVMLASGPRLLEVAGEVADGVMMMVGLHPDGVHQAREHIRRGALRAGRDPADVDEIFIVPFGLGDQQQSRQWVQGWFRDGHPWLKYPSASNLRWLRASGIDISDTYDPGEVSDALAERICDAFGIFGPPDECADRLQRARDEIGLHEAFLFPAHNWDNHYELPRAEVDALGETIIPRLAPA